MLSNKNMNLAVYIHKAASRDLLFRSILLILFIIGAGSMFLGLINLVEQYEAVLTFYASLARIVAIVGVILFISFYTQKSMDSKEIELILSRPISRSDFILGYFLGISLLSIKIVGWLFGILLGISFALGQYGSALMSVVWCISLCIEMLVISIFAMCVGFLGRSAIFSALTCMMLYFMTRIMGYFIFMVDHSTFLSRYPLFEKISTIVIKGVSVMIPRFDMLTQTEWIIYGLNDIQHIFLFIGHAALFIPIFILLTIHDLQKKQF